MKNKDRVVTLLSKFQSDIESLSFSHCHHEKMVTLLEIENKVLKNHIFELKEHIDFLVRSSADLNKINYYKTKFEPIVKEILEMVDEKEGGE